MRSSRSVRVASFLALSLATAACGGKGSGARDPMKICQKLVKAGAASDCAASTTPLDPTFGAAKQLVSFTLAREPGGSGQVAIFASDKEAQSAFTVMRDSPGQVKGDYPHKVVLYVVSAGDSPRALDGQTLGDLAKSLE